MSCSFKCISDNREGRAECGICVHSACGFQSQFERLRSSSVTTGSPLGFMLAKSIRLLESRIACGAAPVICICHLLFSLTPLLPLCLLSPSDDTSHLSFPTASLLWVVLPALCLPCPLFSLSQSIQTFHQVYLFSAC